MSNNKFKVGDVVVARCNQDYGGGYQIQEGYVGTVTDIDDMGYMSVDGKVGAAGGLIMRQGAFELYDADEAGNLKDELQELKSELKILKGNNKYIITITAMEFNLIPQDSLKMIVENRLNDLYLRYLEDTK